MNASDKIIVYHKADPTHPDSKMRDFVKPPFETTYGNFRNYEAVNSKIIKEMYPVGHEPKKEVSKPLVQIKTVEKIVEKEFTTENLIKYFLDKGKSSLSISKYLDLELDLVKSFESELVA